MKAAAKPKPREDDDDDDDNDEHNDDVDAAAAGAAHEERASQHDDRGRSDDGKAGRDAVVVVPSLARPDPPSEPSRTPRAHGALHPAPASLSSPSSTAAAAASSKRKAAKDKDRPKRALSMFNFFFREEREKLMAERAAGTGALAEAERRGIAEGKDANTRKKELFALVGKIIAERWKRVTPRELERLKGLADEDMVRFNDQMSEYQISVARKKRVKDEAAAPTPTEAAAGGRIFPMYPGEPALNLYRPATGSPLASLAAAAASSSSAFQRHGLSVDDQLQRDPSLRLPTPIEELLRARRRAVLGEYTPTSPNTAPSHSPQWHRSHQHSDPIAASPGGSSRLLPSGSFRRVGDGLAESMMPSALLGSGASARPPMPALDASMGGGSAYETQQQLLLQLLQQDRSRLVSGSSALDHVSSLGVGHHAGSGYSLGSLQAQQQQHQHALLQQQQQQQQLRLWPEAQSLRMATSSDVLRSELQRQERDMVALLRQQQQQQQQIGASSAAGLASLSEGSLQQKLSYQELLQIQQHQQQQQQLLQLQRLQQQQLEHQQQQHQQQEQLHQHLRRARRDSDSEGGPDPYP